MKGKISCGKVSLKIHEVGKPRFTGWTGGYGVHQSKKHPSRAKRKQAERKTGYFD